MTAVCLHWKSDKMKKYSKKSVCILRNAWFLSVLLKHAIMPQCNHEGNRQIMEGEGTLQDLDKQHECEN